MRGVVDADGDVVAWPTLLMNHYQAFAALPHLRDYRARWRQWDVDKPVDIDPGAAPEDIAAIEAYLAARP